MATDIAIFRVNYKSDFIITLESDAGWATPFCIKFWTDSPQRAFYVQYDGETYTHCAPVAGEPTKLMVQMDDHHLGVGDLKYQIAYHFTVADFPHDTEDEVLNQAAVIINEDGQQEQVMLDLNGETAPEIAFSLPAYANEAQRIANEQQRIANEQQRIANEEQRINKEQQRITNENQRISNEEARVTEFARLKRESEQATEDANDAAVLATTAADLASAKAQLAQDAANLANQKAQLASDKAALATAAADLATAKAQLAQEKATYAQTQGDYAKAQGDYAKEQGTIAETDHVRAESDHTRAESDHAAVEVYVDSLGAFDISSYHATGGVLAKYADLAAALGTNGANIPDVLRKGGMSVKFVQSSDNKYVQYRLMSDTFNTTVANWQGVDDTPTAGSDNLVKSGGVAKNVVYDISVNHLTDGQPTAYTGFSNAVKTNATNIPESVRMPGMSIKFILEENTGTEQEPVYSYRYVFYMFMGTVADSYNLSRKANWRQIGVDIKLNTSNDIPTSGSTKTYIDTNLSFVDILYDNKKGAYVDIDNIEHNSTLYNLYYFDNIDKYDAIRLFYATGGAYCVFVDDSDNIIGEPFKTGTNSTNSYISTWEDVDIPVGAKRLKVSQSVNHPLTAYPLRVLAHSNIDYLKELFNEVSELENEEVELNASVKEICKDNNLTKKSTKVYTLADFVNLVYDGSTYTSKDNSRSLILPIQSFECVNFSYTSSLENVKLSFYFDANEPVSGGTRNRIKIVTENKDYINNTPDTIWLVLSFKRITENPTITVSVKSWMSNTVVTGKKLLCLGDSITDGGNYVNPLSTILGTLTYNRGWSGACLTKTDGKTNSISGRLNDTPDDSLTDNEATHHLGYPTEADVVTILAGANDWYHLPENDYDISVGSVTDAPDAENSFCSAMHYLLKGLRDRYFNARIYVILPYRIYSDRFTPVREILFNTSGNEDSGFTFVKKRDTNTTLDDLRNIMAEIATMYGAEVIDLRKVGFSFFWEDDREAYSKLNENIYDGLHPNEEGGKIMAGYIAKHILSTY